MSTPRPPYPDHAQAGSAAYFLVGPTAVGKTEVAQELASGDGLDVLSADSMLVYRGMDIGTAKPTVAERGRVVYRGLDLAEPGESFSVGRYLEAAGAACAEAGASGRIQVVVGGTGLYVKALLEGLDADGPPDPRIREAVQRRYQAEGLAGIQDSLRRAYPAWWDRLEDPQNPRRVLRALEQAESGGALPPPGPLPAVTLVGLSMPPAVLQARIEERVKRMYRQGLLEEVAELRARPGGFSMTAAGAIGYAEAMAVMDGKLTEEEAVRETAVRTRRLAKRQRTWFRHQATVQWVEAAGRPVREIAAEVRDLWRTTGPVPVRCPHG